jgi:hypothetical protein
MHDDGLSSALARERIAELRREADARLARAAKRTRRQACCHGNGG